MRFSNVFYTLLNTRALVSLYFPLSRFLSFSRLWLGFSTKFFSDFKYRTVCRKYIFFCYLFRAEVAYLKFWRNAKTKKYIESSNGINGNHRRWTETRKLIKWKLNFGLCAESWKFFIRLLTLDLRFFSFSIHFIWSNWKQAQHWISTIIKIDLQNQAHLNVLQ